MKWLRFQYQNQTLLGTLEGEQVAVHQGDLFSGTTATGQRLALAEVQLLAPCLPGKMLALWNNFAAAAAKNGWSQPPEPLYFLKAPNTYSQDQAVVPRPACFEGRILYEAELGVVIGKRGKNIPLEAAADHVFGYTCVNDVTALDILRADPSFEQWTRAKGFDGFAPIGPWIETDVDPSGLVVKALVNGRERQNYPVSDMFFSPLQLVSLLSRDVTLEPGDIISCGTSLGAGPWQAGASVEVLIEGVGSLRNSLSAAA